MSVSALAEAIVKAFKDTFTSQNPLQVSGGSGGGGGSSATQYSEGTTTNPSTGSVLLFRRTDGTLKAIQGDNNDRIKVDIDRLPSSVGTKTAALSLPVTLSSDGVFTTAFGTASDNVASTDTANTGFVSLVKYLLTRITTLFQGVAGTPNTNVLTVQGITNGTSLIVNQNSNATLITVAFSSSTTSATFAIANRLALIVCPVITGAPTLTLQVSLDGGITWVSTSVTLATSATLPKTIEADSLAKVSGAFGLASAFRFSSTASITATLNVRSVTQ